jgi:hypothetical protein
LSASDLNSVAVVTIMMCQAKTNDTLFGRTILPSHSFEPLFKNEATSSLGTARISKWNANKDDKATCNLALAEE